MRTMIRGIAAAALLGIGTLVLAAAGLLIVVPILVYRGWRRKMHATHG
jgi:hypothetical protein